MSARDVQNLAVVYLGKSSVEYWESLLLAAPVVLHPLNATAGGREDCLTCQGTVSLVYSYLGVRAQPYDGAG